MDGTKGVIKVKINVKFNLKNDKLPYEYRKAIISFYKNILSKYNDGEWKDKFYKNKNPIQKKFAYSFYLPDAKFLEDAIELGHNFFYLNISTYDYETGILLYNAMLNQKDTEFPLAFENAMKIEKINFQLNKPFNKSNIKIRMLSPLPDIIKALKGVSARLLLKQYPELKKQLWDGHLWNPSYFVATVSENTEEQIRNYINSQKER